ncbi:hypothetical protein B0T19DRAFT_398552 [Cercophora scortea]|uniref:Uncharacterized protein n=1 Tax=Cercophora scortea TaxID=314031 RepID=A0AAE0IXN8_9PEZI|nr:hypothetical protein B0T19DRAFT_398552 [Cercophora scortea]
MGPLVLDSLDHRSKLLLSGHRLRTKHDSDQTDTSIMLRGILGLTLARSSGLFETQPNSNKVTKSRPKERRGHQDPNKKRSAVRWTLEEERLLVRMNQINEKQRPTNAVMGESWEEAMITLEKTQVDHDQAQRARHDEVVDLDQGTHRVIERFSADFQ